MRNTSLVANDSPEPPRNFGKLMLKLLACYTLYDPPFTAPNFGTKLWIQQFYAMFLKRLYNSLRFWQAGITQLLLPLLFVLIAMILAITLPNANENDPSRPLTIKNSAFNPDSRLVFFANFHKSSSIDFSVRKTKCECIVGCVLIVFQSVTAESIGATEFLDYTSDAIDMYSYAQEIIENPSQCCNYSYQILDKFCARQKMVSMIVTVIVGRSLSGMMLL